MNYPEDFEYPDGCVLAPSRATHFVQVEVDAGIAGRGVFARERLLRGQVVFLDGGRVIHNAELLPAKRALFQSLIAEGLYLSPRNYDDLEPIWFLNHHCDANLGRFGGLVYAAKRDIPGGEELTVDYSAFIAGLEVPWTMLCACGAVCCRKLITPEDWRRPDIALRLWPEFLPFVQKRILSLGLL